MASLRPIAATVRHRRQAYAPTHGAARYRHKEPGPTHGAAEPAMLHEPCPLR